MFILCFRLFFSDFIRLIFTHTRRVSFKSILVSRVATKLILIFTLVGKVYIGILNLLYCILRLVNTRKKIVVILVLFLAMLQ